MPDRSQRFVPARRKAFLKAIEQGSTQAQACESLKVSPTTIAKWLSRGRKATSGPEFEFASTYDSFAPPKKKRKPRQLVAEQAEGGLSVDQLVSLLEHEALNGNVQALKYLLERPWEKLDDESSSEAKAPTILDELASFRDRKAGA